MNTLETLLLEIKGTHASHLIKNFRIPTLEIKCKWPNDVLVNGKKIAGILIESEVDATTKEVTQAVIGIGVNVLYSPENVMYPATNLEQEGLRIDSADLMKRFVSHFNEVYKEWLNAGFKNTRKSWLENAHRLGEEISVKISEEITVGIFKDLDETGTLIIKRKYGKIIKICSGDVF